MIGGFIGISIGGILPGGITIGPGAPAERTVQIVAESRTVHVPYESRTVEIPFSDRTVKVRP